MFFLFILFWGEPPKLCSGGPEASLAKFGYPVWSSASVSGCRPAQAPWYWGPPPELPQQHLEVIIATLKDVGSPGGVRHWAWQLSSSKSLDVWKLLL